jgi:hypothetical protein
MKIKIDTENQPDGIGNDLTWITDAAKTEIQAALDEVNGSATAFTVHYANDVYARSRRAEGYLIDNNIPESERAGATVTFHPAGPDARAYKNAAIATDVTPTRTGSGWYLTDVRRAQVWPRNPERFYVSITDRACDALIRRTLKAFGREPKPAGQQAA